jgi:hypothetical protein
MKKFNELMATTGNKLTRAVGKTELIVKKNSPEILMGVGIVGIVATVVTACRATLKADEVLDHHNEKMEKIHDAEQFQDEECPYPPEVVKKEKLIVYTQTAVDFVKLYAPTIAVGSLSVACILVSNRIIKKRYLGAVAAYNAISASYETYRSRVREKYGEDVDYEMRYGVKREKIEEKVTDENGKTVKKKTEVEHIDGDPSVYARYWGKYIKDGIINPNWDENPEFNFYFLKAKQDECNMVLHSRGYIFLNEVYNMLKIEQTQVGQVVGWFDDGTGDGYIDFGLYSLNNRENLRLINGKQDEWLLDFNCDGIIWDKMALRD